MNTFKRYQTGLALRDLFPLPLDGSCACGCGSPLSGRKKMWSSLSCQENALTHFFIIKGDTKVIRNSLFLRDKGKCATCGEITSNWEADHILPVFLGGGACGIDNYQTLCKKCHCQKTLYYNFSHQSTISSHAAFM